MCRLKQIFYAITETKFFTLNKTTHMSRQASRQKYATTFTLVINMSSHIQFQSNTFVTSWLPLLLDR